MRVLALAFGGVMLLAGPSTAQTFSAQAPVAPTLAGQRVYEGEEAAAIRCANMMAFTGITLFRAGLMTEEEKDILVGISFLILDRHVSGNWTEKKRAMEVMRDRRDLETTLEDYQRNAPFCLERFPIN